MGPIDLAISSTGYYPERRVHEEPRDLQFLPFTNPSRIERYIAPILRREISPSYRKQMPWRVHEGGMLTSWLPPMVKP